MFGNVYSTSLSLKYMFGNKGETHKCSQTSAKVISFIAFESVIISSSAK